MERKNPELDSKIYPYPCVDSFYPVFVLRSPANSLSAVPWSC